MRSSMLSIVLASIVLGPLALAAQHVKPVSKPTFTSIEVKHFTAAAGVTLPADFERTFYVSFLSELQKLNVAEQTVAEGTPVTDSQGAHGIIPHFIVVEGTFVSLNEAQEQGAKPEAGSMKIEVHLFRRADHRDLTKYKIQVALTGSLQTDLQKVVEAAGIAAADEFRKQMYPGLKPWDFCC